MGQHPGPAGHMSSPSPVALGPSPGVHPWNWPNKQQQEGVRLERPVRTPLGASQSAKDTLSLQKRGDVFIRRRREDNLFLTQLIRIPSIGITMYLIKFTVIYEESTKAQIPVERQYRSCLLSEFLLSPAGRKCFSHVNPQLPTLLAPIAELSHPQGGRAQVLFLFFYFSLLCIQDSHLLTSVKSGA